MSRIALAVLVLVVAGGCSGRDVTAPATLDLRGAAQRASADASSNASRSTKLGYTKWFVSPTAMKGDTDLGDGSFSGTLLSRIPFDNGVIVALSAIYVVTDPSDAGQSFTARVDGKLNLQTKKAVLNGVVTEGRRSGARVHVEFQRMAPCESHPVPVCFVGTIRVLAQE